MNGTGEGSGIPASCYLAPPRPRAGTEPLARLPSSFEGGGYSSSGLASPSGQGDGSSSGDLSPAAALCSLAMAVNEQRKLSGALAMTPEAQAVKKAIIASTTATAGDWHPLIPLDFTLPPHYLPVSPSKMPLSQKKAAIKAAEAAAAAKGEKLDSTALAAIPMFSSHEPTLHLTRVYCGIQKRVYFEVYPHVYELYKLKSSQARNAMLKEMMEIVGPPERVILPLPNLAATGRKPHPCLLITAEGLLQVAINMKNSTPDIVAVLNKLYAICGQESVTDLIYQAEVVHPELVAMGQTWQRAWSGDEAPQISNKLDSFPSSGDGSSSHTPTSSDVSSPAVGAPPEKISAAVQMQHVMAQAQQQQRKVAKKKNERRDRESSGDDGDTEDNTDQPRTIGRVPVNTEVPPSLMKTEQQAFFVPLQRRRIEEMTLEEQQRLQAQNAGCLMPPSVSNIREVLVALPPMQQVRPIASPQQFKPLNDSSPQVASFPMQGNEWQR